jgi:hypothetical protein
MTLSDLASIATVISRLAVLGSLLYLAQQTRQNTRHTRALVQQGRNREIVEFNLTGATDLAMTELLLRGDAGDPALKPAELAAYLQHVLAQLAHVEDGFYQHTEGLIDDERYAGTIAYLQYVRASRPGFRAAWEMYKTICGPKFRAFANAKILEAASFPAGDPGARWLALAAKECERERGQPG